MGVNKIAIGISIGILALVGLIYGVTEKNPSAKNSSAPEVMIEKTWKLPKILSEISAIAFVGKDRVMGVQDEQGKLFVYNLDSSKIEKEVDFAGTGDYEGLALDGDIAYVLRSDGTILKIENYNSNPEVTEISTDLTEKEDTEGLCLDKKNNRLLIAIKEEDPNSADTKGIYAVSLDNMKMTPAPAFELDFKHSLFKNIEEDDPQDLFKPSEINIHPETGEIYVLEGQNPKLVILDSKGTPKQLFQLDEKNFPQPEGLSFDPSGNLYISNEGTPGTIHRIRLN